MGRTEEDEIMDWVENYDTIQTSGRKERRRKDKENIYMVRHEELDNHKQTTSVCDLGNVCIA